MATNWPPTGITLRGWSAYLLAQYPLTELPPGCGGPITTNPPPPSGGGYNPIAIPVDYSGTCDPMKPTIDAALPLLSALTCRDFITGADIPETLVPTATMATAMAVERVTYSTGGDQRETAMGNATGNLRSISAGPWSESYFGAGEVKFAWNVIDPDPAMNTLLMALITPECLANRVAMEQGIFPPGYAVQEIDWTTSNAPDPNFPRCWSEWW